NKLEENPQALLIKLYRLTGANAAALAQYESWSRMLSDEVGTEPGIAVESALRANRQEPPAAGDRVSIQAVIEAGAAAVGAGAVDVAVQSLRGAVDFADRANETSLRIAARMRLAEAFVHSARSVDG